MPSASKYDIISDVHSCIDEFKELVAKLGYQFSFETFHGQIGFPSYEHPEGRKLIINGDHIDRGPHAWRTLRMMRRLQNCGHVILQGGHEEGLAEYLEENPDPSKWDYTLRKKHRHATIQDLQKISSGELADTSRWLRSLPYIWENEDLIVVHASYQPEYIQQDDTEYRAACLHGSPSGWSTAEGWKTRYNNMAAATRTVVTGHRNMRAPKVTGKVVTIDTGCAYGNKLTAFRFPEREFVQVAAHAEYYPIPAAYWWD